LESKSHTATTRRSGSVKTLPMSAATHAATTDLRNLNFFARRIRTQQARGNDAWENSEPGNRRQWWF